MSFWFNRKRKPPSVADTAEASATDAGAPPGAADQAPPAGASSRSVPKDSPKPGSTPFKRMSDRLLAQSMAAPPATPALNEQIVQAVQLSNAETTGYAPSQVAVGPNMMISQAAGLVAQSAAAYFDGVSKLALASQGILLKDMTESLVKQEVTKAAEDALGVLATDVMMGAAAAVAAAAGAMEAESASFAIDRIDQSIAKYADLLANRKPAS
jgi:hypothetical protein